MTATHSRPPQLPGKDEQAQAKEASRQLARLLPAADQPLRLVTADNHRDMVSLPPSALRLLVDILTQLGQGRGVTIVPGKAELTTQEAADYLNVSRPYVIKLIENRKLDARLVGTHRRIAFEDLLRFDEKDRKLRRAALDKLVAIDRDLGL